MVPNQPLRFAGDPGAPRREDRLIAFAWSKFLRGGDPVWLPRLPMTKSAVRAMDTITAYFEKRGGSGPRAGNAPRIGRFVLPGASKRGRANLTTAPAAKRVVRIIPMEIHILNTSTSFKR